MQCKQKSIVRRVSISYPLLYTRRNPWLKVQLSIQLHEIKHELLMSIESCIDWTWRALMWTDGATFINNMWNTYIVHDDGLEKFFLHPLIYKTNSSGIRIYLLRWNRKTTSTNTCEQLNSQWALLLVSWNMD